MLCHRPIGPLQPSGEAPNPPQQAPPPLLWPASQGNIDVVRLLLDQDPDLDAASDIGETALMAAVAGGHVEIVRLLLDHGADPSKPDNDGDTPLGFYAAASGSVEILTLLIEHGADVNAPNANDTRPLMYATGLGDQAMVRILLDHGAQADVRDRYGWTPWLEAVAAGSDVIARLLEEAGALHSESLRAAASTMGEGLGLVQQGNIREALAAFSTAEALDPSFTIPPQVLNVLCWFGSLSGYAESVI